MIWKPQPIYHMNSGGSMEGHFSYCTLVNPLCPNDLCELGYGHKGAALGIHKLATFPDPAKVSDVMFMAPKGTIDEDLIRLGREKAEELFGDE